MKATMIGAIGQSCIVLFGLLIMYCYMMYMIAAFIITLNLVVLIAIVIFPFIIWAWQAFARKVLIQNKIKFLKKEKVYELYKKVSEE